MRSKKFLKAEQAQLVWDVPGLVAGVDEAGRGPLAGPVVAAAVILDDLKPIKGLADSKQLTALRRDRLYDEIRAKALCCSIAQASVEEIDQLNILQATLLAMRRAVLGLRLKPAKVLVDGNRLPALDVLCELHLQHPEYGFNRHKGYGTAEHLRALQTHGALPMHRRSFAPVARALAQVNDAQGVRA
jgi:ribonuclease HII